MHSGTHRGFTCSWDFLPIRCCRLLIHRSIARRLAPVVRPIQRPPIPNLQSRQKTSFLLLNFHRSIHIAPSRTTSTTIPVVVSNRNHRIQRSRRAAVGAFHGATPPGTFSYFLFDSSSLYTCRLRLVVSSRYQHFRVFAFRSSKLSQIGWL
jgi:hypothetical protein